VRLPAALSPLAERNYRLLFTAQAISLIGSWMTPVALAFAVLELTDSPTAVGLVLGAELVPLAGLLLVGGVWADRLPRVPLMVTADVVSGGAGSVMAVLMISGRAEIWHLVVLAALAGSADAFHQPAWAGLLPQTVPPALLQRANALRHLESNIARVAGPLLAGILVATAGAGWAIAVDAASFLAAAVVLTGIKVPDVERAAGYVPGFMSELGAGWRVVRSQTWLLAMLVDTALWVLVIYGPFAVLGPVVAQRELGGATAWSLISAGYGLGAVAGGVLGLHLNPRRPLLTAVVINVAWAPMLVLLAMAGPVPVLVIAAIPAGAAISLYMVLWDTTMQQRVPPGTLARVASFERAATFALMPLGMALAGPVADVVGVEPTLLAGAAWLGVSTVFLLSMPSIRRLERLEPETAV
jgi:MFS family permease